MLATCIRALARAMPFPNPVVISGFFLKPGTAGPGQHPHVGDPERADHRVR